MLCVSSNLVVFELTHDMHNLTKKKGSSKVIEISFSYSKVEYSIQCLSKPLQNGNIWLISFVIHFIIYFISHQFI